MRNKFIYCIVLLIVYSVICGFFWITKKETIAIIGAMDVETIEVAKHLSDIHYKKYGNFEMVIGTLGKYKIVLSKSGVGKVNSATTTQFIIDKYKPSFIINMGIAGGLSPNLKSGDTIIADKMIQHDFDMTAFGCPKGYIDVCVRPNTPTIYYSDKRIGNNFAKDKSIKSGTVVTGDVFVADAKSKIAIRKEFGADAVDMESAAIAQTAKRNNIPVVVIRTISDGINDTTNEYKQNKQNIARKPALIVIEVLAAER